MTAAGSSSPRHATDTTDAPAQARTSAVGMPPLAKSPLSRGALTMDDVDMNAIARVVPHLQEHGRGFCYEAGQGLTGPDDLLRLFDPDSPLAPRSLPVVLAAFEYMAPYDLLSRVKRFVDFCHNTRIWSHICSNWRILANFVHRDPLPFSIALERLTCWSIDMEVTHRWTSVMTYIWHVLDRLVRQGGITAGALLGIDGPKFSDLRTQHLVAIPPAELAPSDVNVLSPSHPDFCLQWNIRINGCTSGARCVQPVKRKHVCAICKDDHRMTSNNDCKEEGRRRGLLSDGGSKKRRKQG